MYITKEDEALDKKYDEIISKYNFNNKQLEAITFGKFEGVDITIYAKPEYTWQQMEFLMFRLLDGEDVTPYLNPKLTIEELMEIRKKKLKKEV